MHTELDPVLSLRTDASQPNFPASRMSRILWAIFFLASISLLLQTPASGQQPATLSGFVADSTGAGVPGASLVLTNQDTAVVQTTAKSDSHGQFEFPQVPAPGIYSLSVQVSGFTRREEKDITVTAGERRSLGTLSLIVGSKAALTSSVAATGKGST